MRSALPLLLAVLLAAPAAHALELDLRLPDGSRFYVGDRDSSGRYWDGRAWRDATWWRDNCSRYAGRKDFRGTCPAPHHDDGPKGGHCPPGQAKKGRC